MIAKGYESLSSNVILVAVAVAALLYTYTSYAGRTSEAAKKSSLTPNQDAFEKVPSKNLDTFFPGKNVLHILRHTRSTRCRTKPADAF